MGNDCGRDERAGSVVRTDFFGVFWIFLWLFCYGWSAGNRRRAKKLCGVVGVERLAERSCDARLKSVERFLSVPVRLR